MAPVVLAAPRGHVLAEQRDFLRARFDQLARFGHQIAVRTRDFRAARIGHHAIGAELVAAFLHGEEGGRADPPAFGQRGELGDRGHVGIGRAFALHRAVQHFGQAVVGLRADDHAHRGRAFHDLLALGLRDAARDRDHRRLGLRLALGQAADVRIDLLRRLLADVAGVEHHQIGVLALGRRRNALRIEHLGHALAVIDVHLAAEALDPVGLGRGVGRFHRLNSELSLRQINGLTNACEAIARRHDRSTTINLEFRCRQHTISDFSAYPIRFDRKVANIPPSLLAFAYSASWRLREIQSRRAVTHLKLSHRRHIAIV